MSEKYTIGLDFGTLSGRAILVRVRDGQVLAGSTMDYPHGVISSTTPGTGLRLGESWALQDPADYLEVMKQTLIQVVKESGVPKEDIIGIGMDFTACTMLPVDEEGMPLCRQSRFRDRRNAYVKLWKHHGAQAQADRINQYLEENHLEELPVFGGRVSSEVMIPKILETLQEDPEIYEAAAEFLEAGDWLTRMLTGSRARSVSMAGYKAWWDAESGYPEPEFFGALDPGLQQVAEKLGDQICAVDQPVGCLSREWADRLGLQEGIVVAPAVIDSHAGVPGCGICGDRQAMLVLGTSSVMIALGSRASSGEGVYGNVRDAIVPGYFGYESGLACVGDLFDWFVKNQVPASYEQEAELRGLSVHQLLSEKAAQLEPGESGLLALDWWNGNKTPYVDSSLKGMVLGYSLATKPEEIYRALIEATAYGTRRILEAYQAQGIRIDEIICSGGITHKNPLLMQIYADVLGKPLKVAASEQTAALGSAVYAALCAGSGAGGYDDYAEAVRQMAQVEEQGYVPIESHVRIYGGLYERYRKLGELLVKMKE